MKVFSSNHHRRHQHSTIIPFPSLCMLTKPTIIGLPFLQASRWDDHCILEFFLPPPYIHNNNEHRTSILIQSVYDECILHFTYHSLQKSMLCTFYITSVSTDLRYIYSEWLYHGLKLWIYMRKTSLYSSCLQLLSWNLCLTGRRWSRRKRLQMMWTQLCWAARQKRFHLLVKTLL